LKYDFTHMNVFSQYCLYVFI